MKAPEVLAPGLSHRLGLSILYFLCSSSHLRTMSQIIFATIPAPTDIRKAMRFDIIDTPFPLSQYRETDKYIIPYFQAVFKCFSVSDVSVPLCFQRFPRPT